MTHPQFNIDNHHKLTPEQKQKYLLEEILINLNKFKNVKELTELQQQWTRDIFITTRNLIATINITRDQDVQSL